MRKSFIICLTLVLTFFTMPFGGMKAMADGKAFDDIEDGDYEITAKALHADKDEASGAAGFIEEDAILSIQDGEVELTITIPHNDMAEIEGLQIEGNAPITQDEGTGNWTYKLDTLKPELVSQVQYAVPSIGMEHDVPFRFMLEGLDELPVKEEEPETPEEPEDEPEDNGAENGSEDENGDEDSEDTGEDENGSENENGNDESEDADDENGSEDENGDDESEDTGDENGSEDENGNDESEDADDENESEDGENGSDSEEGLIENADEVYEMEYMTNSPSTERNFHNPVKLLVKDGKKYIEMNGSGGQFITSLTVNGDEVIWGDIDEDGNFVIQFELSGSPSEEIDFGMTISPPGMDDMNHIVPMSFAKPVELNQPYSVTSGEIIKLKDTLLTMPESLPENVTLTITSLDEVQNQGDLEIAGKVYDFNFDNLGDNPGTFELVMNYDQNKYNNNDYELDIYYFDGDEWVAQDGAVEDGKVTVNVDHFSTYGVFAKETESSDESESPGQVTPSDPIKVPDNAEEIDYVIMNENGDKKSNADSFFEKPGLLFEYNDKQYVEVTINNGDMVKELSTFDTDATVVEENDGSIVVQFQVNDDLSDTLLNMRVVVPGMYDTEHTTLFSIIDEENGPEQIEEDPNNDSETPTKGQSELQPDKVSEIDYTIKQEDGIEDSVANDFFTGKAILLEKDGQTYAQLTITDGDMVKELSNKYGPALLVEKNKDGSIVVQLKVDSDLSDMILDMHIVVPEGAIPGFPGYNEQHKALLVFDKDTQKELDEKDYVLAGSNDSDNESGPFIEGSDPKPINNKIEKPEFGDNGDTDKNADDTVKPDKTDNPQTGDTTNIFLYAMLLIGSFIPLAIKLRRRFI